MSIPSVIGLALATALQTAPTTVVPQSGVAFEPTRTVSADLDAITGVVWNARHEHVPAAIVTPVATPRTGLLGLFADASGEHAPPVRCDADGRFRFPAARGRPYELRVLSADGLVGYVPACFAGEAVSLVLAPPAMIRVHAFDARTKAPLAGVEISAQWLESNIMQQFGVVPHSIAAAITDQDGIARLGGLPPALVDFACEPYTSGLVHARPWRVLAGEASTLELPVTERLCTLHGRVVDAAQQPVKGARVSPSLRCERSVETDEDGHFTISTFAADTGVTLFVRKNEFALSSFTKPDPQAREEVPVIALQPGRTVRGRVVDGKGAAIPAASLAFVNEETWNFDPPEALDLVFGQCDAAGEFVVRGLRADVRHVVTVSSGTFALVVQSLPDGELGSTELDLGRIALQAPQLVTGTFVELDGTPNPDTTVMLTLAAPAAVPPGRIDPRGGFARVDRMLGSVRTDCAGRFRFDRVPPGVIGLHGTSQRLIAPVRLRLSEIDERENIVLRQIEDAPAAPPLPACGVKGRIDAHVRAADGTPAARVAISICPEDYASGPVRTAFSDEAGAFTVEFLQPGCYRAVLEWRDGFADAAPLRARRFLASDEFQAFARADPGSAARTLMLRDVIRVHGRIVDANDPTQHTWLVTATSNAHANATACVASARDGSFEFQIEDGALLTLLVTQLLDDASVPHSAVGAQQPWRFIVHDVVARKDELIVPVPR